MNITESGKHINALEKQIKEDFGERCTDFCYGCFVCGAYLAIDILRDLYTDEPIHEHETN